MGTPTAAPPPWLIEKHPEFLPVRRDGSQVSFGGRHHDCQSNQDYRESIEILLHETARHYRENPAIVGWQIDNELGNSHQDLCFCDSCCAQWRRWLSERYASIDDLNEAWGTVFWSQTYDSFDQVPSPMPTANSHNPSLLLDWRRFASDLIADFQKFQVDILRSECPDHFVTHNFMGFFDKVRYDDLAKELDFVSHDQYPMAFQGTGGTTVSPGPLAMPLDYMRCLKGGAPFWIMEQQAGPSGWEIMGPTPRPGQLRLWTAQSIAHGADTVVYFRWRTCLTGTEQYWHGVLPHSGQAGRRFDEIRATVRELGPVIDEMDGALPKARIAMVHSYDESWAMQIQPHHPELDYIGHLGGYYEAFHEKNVPIDFVNLDSDLSAYSLVILPLLFLVKEELVDRLIAYVRGGGHLLLTMRTGVKDWTNRVLPHTLPGRLGEVLGISVPDYDCLVGVDQGVRWKGSDIEGSVAKWADIIETKGADVIAEYTMDYYAGSPAITSHVHGDGLCYYVGTELSGELRGYLAKLILDQVSIQPIMDSLEGVEVSSRIGDEAAYHFVLNHTADSTQVRIPAEWQSIRPEKAGSKGTLNLNGFDFAVFRGPRP